VIKVLCKTKAANPQKLLEKLLQQTGLLGGGGVGTGLREDMAPCIIAESGRE